MGSIWVLLGLLAVDLTFAQETAGVTTRYYDCCKPSCSWSGVAPFSNPVTTCNVNDEPFSVSEGGSASSGCDSGGEAFACSSQQPFSCSSTLAYGFAAVSSSLQESDTCCACYQLTFTSGPIEGSTMVVQAVNTGNDVSTTQFDLTIPGGGVGEFTQGCTTEWNAPADGWGAQYGGVSSLSQCSTLPSALQRGCDFRFDWMQGANNPTVNYERVACPAELTAITNCKRDDDSGYPAAPACNASGGSGGSSTTTSKQSSTTSSTKTTHSSTTSTTTSSGPGATQTEYGQCGGANWTGPTKCAAGTTCQFQNDYYSQCLT